MSNRTYVGEMELALEEANMANNDRNPNQHAQVYGWLEYALDVVIAKRSREKMPERPNKESMI